MPTAAHSSGFIEEQGYLYAFELALKLVAQILQCFCNCSKWYSSLLRAISAEWACAK